MGISFENWWFDRTTVLQVKVLISLLLLLHLHCTPSLIICHLVRSPQEPDSPLLHTSCNHLHQCKASAKHHHMAASREVWLRLRSTTLFHQTKQWRMRLKSFGEGLRVHTHTAFAWTRQTALVHLFAFDLRMPSCRPVGREISLCLQSNIGARCCARQERMLLWLNTGRGRFGYDTLSIQVTYDGKLAAAEPMPLRTCWDGGGTQRLAPPGQPLVPLPKWEDSQTPACLMTVPWSFPNLTTSCTKCYRHFVCSMRLPQTVARGTCTLPMALCGVAGFPAAPALGNCWGVPGPHSVPRFPPSRARPPSPAGFLGTRMAY